jgi:hypothetical protein
VLLVDDGAQVSSGSFASASGKAGDLIVNASESVKLSGGITVDGRWAGSGLFSSTQGKGEAGSLMVNTPVLLVDNGAVVSVSTAIRLSNQLVYIG